MALAFAESEYRHRLTRARQSLQTAGLDGCICVAPEHLYYLSGSDEDRAVMKMFQRMQNVGPATTG